MMTKLAWFPLVDRRRFDQHDYSRATVKPKGCSPVVFTLGMVTIGLTLAPSVKAKPVEADPVILVSDLPTFQPYSTSAADLFLTAESSRSLYPNNFSAVTFALGEPSVIAPSSQNFAGPVQPIEPIIVADLAQNPSPSPDQPGEEVIPNELESNEWEETDAPLENEDDLNVEGEGSQKIEGDQSNQRCSLATPQFCFEPEDQFVITELLPEPSLISEQSGPIDIQTPRVYSQGALDGLKTGFTALPTGVSISRVRRINLEAQFTAVYPNKDRTDLTLVGGERVAGLDLSHLSPAIWDDDNNRIGYRLSLFSLFSPDSVFLSDGDVDKEIFLPVGNEQVPWVNRIGGRTQFFIPTSETTVLLPGFRYERVRIQNRAFTDNLFPVDEDGNALSFSDEGKDDLMYLSFFVQDINVELDDYGFPLRGGALQVGTEQSIPLGISQMNFNRLSGTYFYALPFHFFGFTEGPRTMLLSFTGGSIIGEVPGYEAFGLGGSNSVIGFDQGALGTARSFVQLRAEYRFPILQWEDGFFEQLRGALFLQYASDLGSDDTVRGRPATVRDKDGSGGGLGLRLSFLNFPVAGVLNTTLGVNTRGNVGFTVTVGPQF